MTIKFGTDGWRAVISDTFTFGNLRLVAQAIADYVREENDTDQTPQVVVGFDTRFLSDRYATEVARVLAGNGIIAWLTRADAPTPAISYAVSHKQALAIYEALHTEAVSLGVISSKNILDGLDVTIRIAKAINGLSS